MTNAHHVHIPGATNLPCDEHRWFYIIKEYELTEEWPMSIEIPPNPNDELVKAASRLGYVGMVSHRSTIKGAFDDAIEMCKADDGTSVPVFLATNTMALAWAQERLDCIEMMDAIISYCEDNSRSERRRVAMIDAATTMMAELTND